MLDSGSDGIPCRIGTARFPTSGHDEGGSGIQTLLVSRSRSRSLLKSTDRSRERRFQCSKEVDVKRRPTGCVVLVLLHNGCNSYVAPSRAFSANWTRLTRICGAFLLIHSLIVSFSFEGRREYELIYTCASHKTNYRCKIHNRSHTM